MAVEVTGGDEAILAIVEPVVLDGHRPASKTVPASATSKPRSRRVSARLARLKLMSTHFLHIRLIRSASFICICVDKESRRGGLAAFIPFHRPTRLAHLSRVGLNSRPRHPSHRLQRHQAPVWGQRPDTVQPLRLQHEQRLFGGRGQPLLVELITAEQAGESHPEIRLHGFCTDWAGFRGAGIQP